MHLGIGCFLTFGDTILTDLATTMAAEMVWPQTEWKPSAFIRVCSWTMKNHKASCPSTPIRPQGPHLADSQ